VPGGFREKVKREEARTEKAYPDVEWNYAAASATLIFLDFALARGKITPVPGASSFAKAMAD